MYAIEGCSELQTKVTNLINAFSNNQTSDF